MLLLRCQSIIFQNIIKINFFHDCLRCTTKNAQAALIATFQNLLFLASVDIIGVSVVPMLLEVTKAALIVVVLIVVTVGVPVECLALSNGLLGLLGLLVRELISILSNYRYSTPNTNSIFTKIVDCKKHKKQEYSQYFYLRDRIIIVTIYDNLRGLKNH